MVHRERRHVASRGEETPRPRESIEEKARRVPLGSVPLGSRTRAENAHARSPFFLFKPDRPREPPFDVPSRPLRLHRLHCYTFSDVIRTSELGSGFDVTLVNAISERLAEGKKKEGKERREKEEESEKLHGKYDRSAYGEGGGQSI